MEREALCRAALDGVRQPRVAHRAVVDRGGVARVRHALARVARRVVERALVAEQRAREHRRAQPRVGRANAEVEAEEFEEEYEISDHLLDHDDKDPEGARDGAVLDRPQREDDYVERKEQLVCMDGARNAASVGRFGGGGFVFITVGSVVVASVANKNVHI